jgi:hypothetical protein
MKQLSFKLGLFVLILTCFTHCITYQKCVEKFNIKTDSIRIVTYRDTIVPVYIHSTDTVRTFGNIHDTLIVHSGTAHAEAYTVHDTLLLETWSSDTILKVKLDSAIKVINFKEKQVVTVTQKAKLDNVLKWVFGIVVVIMMIVLIQRVFKKK